jgi:hypothetical protein
MDLNDSRLYDMDAALSASWELSTAVDDVSESSGVCGGGSSGSRVSEVNEQGQQAAACGESELCFICCAAAPARMVCRHDMCMTCFTRLEKSKSECKCPVCTRPLIPVEHALLAAEAQWRLGDDDSSPPPSPPRLWRQHAFVGRAPAQLRPASSSVVREVPPVRDVDVEAFLESEELEFEAQVEEVDRSSSIVVTFVRDGGSAVRQRVRAHSRRRARESRGDEEQEERSGTRQRF